MEPQCFVDGDVAEWQSEDDDAVGCDIWAVVVYHPAIGRKTFESGCDWLEDRAEARIVALLEAASRRGRAGLGLVDAETVEDADRQVERQFGSSFLETFVNDTAMVAHDRVGAAFARMRSLGTVITPQTAAESLDVAPAKSFRTLKHLEGYLHDARGNWKPSVRLTLSVSVDGPFAAVEEAASVLRSALSSCGPVTEWRQRMRPCRQDTAATRRLSVVGG